MVAQSVGVPGSSPSEAKALVVEGGGGRRALDEPVTPWLISTRESRERAAGELL